MLTDRQMHLKRFFDMSIALCVLILGWPLILVLILIATIDTGSIGLFSQSRIGRFGRPFKLYKVRTMCRGQEGPTVTHAGDVRVTPLGRVLRRWKLDELPQFWNVLFGSLSLVGPRPDIAGFADQLQGLDRHILDVRPGITAGASIRWRHEETLLAAVPDPITFNREIIWPDKVQCNLDYIRHWSLSGDIRLIMATLLPTIIHTRWQTMTLEHQEFFCSTHETSRHTAK
jgi:lipopolysaccharide/colanic/teichoic acid biosynthesis glycosyltransferase